MWPSREGRKARVPLLHRVGGIAAHHAYAAKLLYHKPAGVEVDIADKLLRLYHVDRTELHAKHDLINLGLQTREPSADRTGPRNV